MMLFFLSFVSLLNFYDRGAFVGSMTLIKEEYDLTDDEAGLFGSAFIIGYALASPIMAQLSRYMKSGLLLSIGMVAWCLATGLCFFASGLPHGFEFLMVMRCLTGIGEAAFICLSPALIDDVAPPTQRSRWLAIFFSMLPLGYAAGYMGTIARARHLCRLATLIMGAGQVPVSSAITWAGSTCSFSSRLLRCRLRFSATFCPIFVGPATTTR